MASKTKITLQAKLEVRYTRITDRVEDMFEPRLSPKIFCLKKASYNSVSVREIISFYSSTILPTLMVITQTQNYKACVIMGLKLMQTLQTHSRQLYVLHNYMHDINKPDVVRVKR